MALIDGPPALLAQELKYRPQSRAGDPGQATLDDATVERTQLLMKEKEKKQKQVKQPS